jgi:hypothetical protein
MESEIRFTTLLQLPHISRHIEFRRRWNKPHGMNDSPTAKREHDGLVFWLGRIDPAALQSLGEAGVETLTAIKLPGPPLLRKTLQSTNPIESMFSIQKSVWV